MVNFIAKCDNKKCKKRKKCIRFTKATGAEIEFKNICSKKNSYKWFWQEKQS